MFEAIRGKLSEVGLLSSKCMQVVWPGLYGACTTTDPQKECASEFEGFQNLSSRSSPTMQVPQITSTRIQAERLRI